MYTPISRDMSTQKDFCFICKDEFVEHCVFERKYHFDESVLNRMPCDCYKHHFVHVQCFDITLDIDISSINKCIVCHTPISLCIQRPDYELQSVQLDWTKLQFVNNQTPEICLAAVQQDAWALRFVKNQTPEICLAAVKQDARALQFVKEPTDDIRLAAKCNRTCM